MPAPEGNKYAEGNKGGGRPSEYKLEYANMAYNIALLGATDAELANVFDVSEQTINNWKNQYEEFSLALKNGKLIADSEVARSLYKKAIGFTNEEVKIFQYEGEAVIVPFTAYYPPDTAAINIWLKNRRGKVDKDAQRWADKHELTGEGGGAIQVLMVESQGCDPIDKPNEEVDS